ncbi:MAG TPA: hypothetical protein PLD23_00865 [Armatimonadota bacterium]|nr:hypothetical protein [Armatimonadota bacterium]
MGRGSLRPYLFVFTAQFRMLLQCRAIAVAGLGFLLASLWTWQFGVRHYRSTGS